MRCSFYLSFCSSSVSLLQGLFLNQINDYSLIRFTIVGVRRILVVELVQYPSRYTRVSEHLHHVEFVERVPPTLRDEQIYIAPGFITLLVWARER